MALTGQSAGDCTIKATSSLPGAASATRTVAITTRVQNTVSCAPDAPRAGDAFTEEIGSRSNVYNMPRTITNSSPNNPIFRTMKSVQATYNYTAGTGGLVNLNTTNVTNSGTAANPAVPSGAWDGFVPLPVWGGFAAGIRTPGSNPDGSDTYVFNADGSINSVPKRPPTAAKVPANSNLLPVQETMPYDWQRQIALARDAAGTAAGGTVKNFSDQFLVTVRQTGGWLNSLQYSIQGGTTGGASYTEQRYYVKAVFNGFTQLPTTAAAVATQKGGASASNNPNIDSVGSTLSTASGKLQYGNFCKFTYTFQKVNATNGGTLQETADATAWDGTSPFKADTTASCTGNCATFSNIGTIKAGPGQTMNDWMGTFYTHDALPRVAKNFITAIGRSGGQNAAAGGDTVPQGAGSYYDYKTGNDVSTDTPSPSGSTPPSNVNVKVQSVTRLALP